MKTSSKQFGLAAISGEDRSLKAAVARTIALAIEPFYAAAMSIRNACYDRGIFATHDLGQRAISVGNITTGGTGKTPVVQWLADQLREQGRHPAVLLRGYGSTATGISDEAQVLHRALNDNGKSLIPVLSNPSRIDGAKLVLSQHPQTDLFILDDAFQHRRAKRDFNLVLISATEPFGFGHVLPRGLLREPLSGLERADAFLITRCGQVHESQLGGIDRYLNSNHPGIPVYHSDHQHTGLWLPLENRLLPMTAIFGQRIFLVAGIGDPNSFQKQFHSSGSHAVGTQWFDDHHAYSPGDVDAIVIAAKKAGADRIIATEKDWVKLQSFSSRFSLPVAVTRLALVFRGDDEEQLLTRINASLVDA